MMGVSHEGFHAGIMLSSSTNKHHPPLSVYLIIPTSILPLISLPIDLISCMHACCCLPGSQHPCLLHTFLFNLIHAQIILSYCGLPSFWQELQPLTCRAVCVPSISIHIWEVVERCDAHHAFLECVMLACIALKGVWTALHGRLAVRCMWVSGTI